MSDLYFFTLHIHLYINYSLLAKASRLLGRIIKYILHIILFIFMSKLVVQGGSFAFF